MNENNKTWLPHCRLRDSNHDKFRTVINSQVKTILINYNLRDDFSKVKPLDQTFSRNLQARIEPFRPNKPKIRACKEMILEKSKGFIKNKEDLVCVL